MAAPARAVVAVLPTDSAPKAGDVNLVDAFRVLDGVSELLGMVVEGREAQVATAAGALYGRFAAADALLDSLPGADLTHAAQLAEAKRLTTSLKEKRALVAKYRELSVLSECVAAQKEVTGAPAEDVGSNAQADVQGGGQPDISADDAMQGIVSDRVGAPETLDIVDLDNPEKLELDADDLSVDVKDIEVIEEF